MKAATNLLLALGALIVFAGGSGIASSAQLWEQSAQAWEIGPIIRSRNYSVGMPPHPTPAGRGWYFDFPHPDRAAGHVHYVTFDPGSLSGKSRIVVRYRVEAAGGARFVPQESPGTPATVSLFFQRRGDTWSGRRQYEFYRWYAPGETVREIAPGEFRMVVDLDSSWISVQGRPATANRAAFAAALDQAGSVGLVFGSAAARGHGIYATAPARFTLIDFELL